MKRLVLLFLLLSGFFKPAHAQLIWFGKKMTVEKAEARWGREDFDTARFKSGGIKTRSKMASSIVRNKRNWIGKRLTDVRKELGSHDGFYFTDTVPAYLISWGEKPEDEIWQIVFLPDTDYLVKDIIIELNGS